MSTDQQRLDRALHQYPTTFTVFGAVRPERRILNNPQRVRKGSIDGTEVFTDISISNSRHAASFNIEFHAYATSPQNAIRVAAVYVSQLCDLVSAVTRQPVRFYMPGDDARHERIQSHNQTAVVERLLTKAEWDWITGSRAHLLKKHARYLAAASSYRKGLLGSDDLDCLCCFWRAIERLALSYSDKSGWTDEKKRKSAAFDCILQLAADIYGNDDKPSFLCNPDGAIKKVKTLRDDISHGNVSITPSYIEEASSWIPVVEEAAYSLLTLFRQDKLVAQAVEEL